MKHPFQILIADKLGEHIFSSVKNHLMVFRVSDGKLLGSWIDHVDAQEFQEKRFRARIEEQRKKEEEKNSEEEPASKKTKTNKKEPKVPAPGPGAPTIYNYIRSLTLSRNEKYLIGTTDSDKAAVIFTIDYSRENCLELLKRQVFPKRPCSVLTTLDDKQVVVADKFGDVYEIDAEVTEVVAEKDLVPILGHVSMLSEVIVAEHENKLYVLTGDRDEHIKVSHYPKTYVVRNWLFGHHEFVSCLHICDFNKDILISGGGDDYLLVWNWWEKTQLSRIELRELLTPFLNDSHLPPERFLRDDSEREICISKVTTYCQDDQKVLVVLCENTKCLLTFKIEDNMNFVHKQTYIFDHPVIDFVIVSNKVLAAIDIETDDNLLQMLQFDEVCNLQTENSPLTSEITKSVECDVDNRSQFYPLYYISSLRKRSEH